MSKSSSLSSIERSSGTERRKKNQAVQLCFGNDEEAEARVWPQAVCKVKL
jgi:hypothetical protein